MTRQIDDKPDSYWKEKLTAEQYYVTRKKGTEPAFSGEYVNNHLDGLYRCVACGEPLFASDTKFDSHSGWPSFSDPINTKHITVHEDTSYGMKRAEVSCAQCGAHLGHVFEDGPTEKGGMRYCINSVSLNFDPKRTGSEK